ncbi:TIGR00730 family Rossman fold protein [bacterium]|nr:TIGR00730 family Rossman fold protein [bacterium]
MENSVIKNICVYSSSCNSLDKVYYNAAAELGRLMGQNGYNLVYGGGRLGMMFANADEVKKNGGRVTGVMPEKLFALGISNPECDERHVTKCMRTRKAKMDELSDAVVALAGGFGTLEELSEMIVQKQLGYHSKPIVILNTNHYYDKLIEFFNNVIAQNFAANNTCEIYFIAQTPQDVINYLKNYKPQKFNVYKKLELEEI